MPGPIGDHPVFHQVTPGNGHTRRGHTCEGSTRVEGFFPCTDKGSKASREGLSDLLSGSLYIQPGLLEESSPSAVLVLVLVWCQAWVRDDRLRCAWEYSRQVYSLQQSAATPTQLVAQDTQVWDRTSLSGLPSESPKRRKRQCLLSCGWCWSSRVRTPGPWHERRRRRGCHSPSSDSTPRQGHTPHTERRRIDRRGEG